MGGLVAVAMHFAATSRHLYLAGLIPLFPIFALFAHAMFASSGRTADLQVSAQFGMLAMIPYGIYLLLAWWLADRMNIWLALVIAALSWGLVAAVVVLVWNAGGSLVSALFSTRSALAVLIGMLFGSLVSSRNCWNDGLLRIRNASTGRRRRAQAASGIASPVTFLFVGIVSACLLIAQPALVGPTGPEDPGAPDANRLHRVHSSVDQPETGVAMPPQDLAVCDLLREALVAGPGKAAGRIQQRVLAKYVALAKNALLTGDLHLAEVYQRRAEAMLYGSWADNSARTVRHC